MSNNTIPLNRKERKAFEAAHKGEPTVKINLLQKIEAMDADCTIIMNKDKEAPTLKEILLFGLRQAHQDDQRTGLKEKQERYTIIKLINGADEVEIPEGARKLCLDRVGKMYLQVELVGKVAEALEPKEPEPSAPEHAPTEGK